MTNLASHVNLTGLLHFPFLFVMVKWVWLNGTMYHDIHGNNDIRTRLFTFLQMIAVAAMAVFAHDAVERFGLFTHASFAQGCTPILPATLFPQAAWYGTISLVRDINRSLNMLDLLIYGSQEYIQGENLCSRYNVPKTILPTET